MTLTAKYERIAADLRRQIRSMEPGGQMPAQTALAEQFRVSLPTVQQALGVLLTEGLIETKHGLGTYVRIPHRRVRRTPARYQWEKDRALSPLADRQQTGSVEYDTGLDMTDLEFHADYQTEKASAELAAVFGVAIGTKLLHRHYQTRVRNEGVAVSLIDSYLIHEMIAGNPELLTAKSEPWPGGTFNQLSTVGIEIDRIHEEITARPPQDDETDLLGVGPGIAVLVLNKTSVDVNGRVVEFSTVVMPGDRTMMTYETQLERWPS